MKVTTAFNKKLRLERQAPPQLCEKSAAVE
jgi:hypothetical protein